ncbi:methyl-accepting chemotaxis protein [Arhodomonas aquaeolei]|uniref:methyl-accepting chemotaxis protein n=1 Tax=Arhodomonas aquaeolei TaxID=2369 RepID=UPI002168C13C|nr:methyl-accepting chemotaxis protein [Arhodomonas aquaeolei]MCS4502828.1 methyl-accepting chemotaxis protein [Arhodomonas aquaeolei]
MFRLLTSSIRNKLLLNTGLGTGLTLGAALFAMAVAWQGLQTYRGLLDSSLVTQADISSLNQDLDRQLLAWKDIMLLGADPAREKAEARFRKQGDSIEEDSKALISRLDDMPEVRALLKRFRSEYAEMRSGYDEALQVFVDSGYMRLTARAMVDGLAEQPRQTLVEVQDRVDERLQGMAQETAASTMRNFMITLVLIAIAVLVAFAVFLFLLRRSITRPAGELVEGLQAMAAGDFTRPVERHTQDELGRVAEAAERLRTDVGELVGEVRGAVARLGESAEQTAALAEHNRTAITTQREETSQVATAMNEMNATVQEVARNAGEAAESAASASRDSENGRGVVETTVSRMDQLAQRIDEAGTAVEQLDQHSTAIGSVLDVIRDIAEQTNLLALNAAIEAARAGEQGRGFAVVAEEVRALARRTAESTDQIQRTIEELQSGSRRSVELMGESRGAAGEVVEQAREAGAALQRIAEGVQRINEMNDQIASAAEEQSATTDEMNRSISNIAQVADDSAETAGETTRASESLQRLADELDELVRRFRISAAR